MKKNKYNIQPYGNCPVQAHGFLPTGEEYYFRARHSHWSMSIGSDPVAISCEFRDGWKYSEQYGDKFQAGWMPHSEAIKFAIKAIKKYYAASVLLTELGKMKKKKKDGK